MKDNTDRTLILIGLVCLFLLLLHFLPPLPHVRPVSILSDLTPTPTVAPSADTLSGDSASSLAHRQGWRKGVEPITDYSQNGAGGMVHFYAVLDSLQRSLLTARPLRIAYFSDSFTEGDLLCADLRERLQTAFGGQGVGWIDAANESNDFRISLAVSSHGLVEHVALKKGEYDAARLGLAGRYAPLHSSATLRYRGGSLYPHAASWQVVRLYAQTAYGIDLTLTDGSGSQPLLRHLQGTGVREAVISQARPVSETELTLRGIGTVYGASLEGTGGIVLDNFSMRGSSGLPLGQISDAVLRAFQQLRHYDLVILAFGGNAVGENTTEEDNQWYIRRMTKVVEKFRTCLAPSSILVFSTPDHGVRSGGTVSTPPRLKEMVTLQQSMAQGERVAFFNLWHAEGGEGAAGRLNVQRLVSDDLLHISKGGGAFLAGRIYDSLLEGLRQYRQARTAAATPQSETTKNEH